MMPEIRNGHYVVGKTDYFERIIIGTNIGVYQLYDGTSEEQRLVKMPTYRFLTKLKNAEYDGSPIIVRLGFTDADGDIYVTNHSFTIVETEHKSWQLLANFFDYVVYYEPRKSTDPGIDALTGYC